MSDALLAGIDDVSVDDEIDFLLSAGEASGTGYSPSSPYWEVDRDFFLKVLRVISTLPSRSTVYLALWLDPDSGCLMVHANNKDAVIECAVPMSCSDPYRTDRVYFLDYSILASFVSQYKKFFFSFDGEGGIYFETPYSRVDLETFNLKPDQAKMTLDYAGLGWKPFLVSRRDMMVFKSLFGMAVSINDNKVYVAPDSAYANYTLYQYTARGRTGLDELLVLRKIDVPTLCEVCDGDLDFALTDSRTYFRFPLGVISFMRLDASASPAMVIDLSGEAPKQSFSVDVRLLKKALGLTQLLRISSVDFASGEGEQVIMTAGERARFVVGTGSLSEPFSLSVELLAKMCGTIPVGEMFLNFNVYDGYVSLQTDGQDGYCYLISMTTVGQMGRKQRLEERNAQREERLERKADAGVTVANAADQIGSDGLDNILMDI